MTSINNDLQFPQEVNIFGAGTLGEHVSYLGEVTFAENPDGSVAVELEHAHMGFDSPFGPEDLFHFRIGKFAPNLADGFQEMWISTDAGIDSLFAFNPIGLDGGTGLGADAGPAWPISLPALVRGIEGYGIITHRALWVAGFANGIGPEPDGHDGPIRREQREGCLRPVRLQVRRHGPRRRHRRAARPRQELARQLAAARRVHLSRRRQRHQFPRQTTTA